ncbi:MAG TPA: potassium-transporting ATPase subunit KdpA [Firmicutes bacterium]|nr:potassium-transporting ATPase subunit KdpA [Bacillota bacterium]
MKFKVKRRMSVWRYLTLGYLLLILFGSFLLVLPFAKQSGEWGTFADYVDGLFTATSATCVTGLTPVVTAEHWTTFGHVVILCLIQVGGLGFTTLVSILFMAIGGKNFGLYERTAMVQSVGESKLTGVKKLVKRILLGTLIFEAAGALLLMIRFIPDYGAVGIWYGVFHSISAFCNAGFDIIGPMSLVDYARDPLVSLVICFLIIIGGLGFCVWGDVADCKGNPRKFQFYTRLALIGTAVLLIAGTSLFMVFEWNNPSYAGFNFGDKLLCSFFNATTARTAGYFTTDPATLSNSGTLLMIILMFIGACSGSTGGGVKVSTFTVILVGMFSVMRGKKDITIGKRRIDHGTLVQALAVFVAYLVLTVTATLLINAIEPDRLNGEDFASFSAVMFETVSAIGTVGLTQALTAKISVVSEFILIMLMYLGRVGILTFAFALKRNKKSEAAVRRPIDNVFIG